MRYNGKYLYEELVEKSEFDPRQNESTIENEESFLLRNQSRIESIRSESGHTANESNAQLDEDVVQSKYDDFFLFGMPFFQKNSWLFL